MKHVHTTGYATVTVDDETNTAVVVMYNTNEKLGPYPVVEHMNHYDGSVTCSLRVPAKKGLKKLLGMTEIEDFGG